MSWLDDERFEALRGRTHLVTGGAGFIGSHIARGIQSLGGRVVVLDDLSSGHADNIPPDATFVRASILDPDALRSAIEGCDSVFHEAAMVSVPQSVEDPARCQLVNVEGTRLVLESARSAGVRRVVFAASAAAYGDEPSLPSCESDQPSACSPYAYSKIAGELLSQVGARCFELSTICLRYFNIFGPRQDPNSPYAAAISAFASRLLGDQTITVFGDGQQTRDFTYVDNVVRANLLAACVQIPMTAPVVNIGTGRRVSLLEVIASMAQTLGVEASIEHGPARAGDVRHSCADITRARELLGYQPMVDLHQGLAHTLSWMAQAAST